MSFRHTFFGSVKKFSAYWPPSRPTPLVFIPPNGTLRSRSIPQLILCGVKPPLPRATIRRERGAPVKLAGGTFLSHDAVVVRFQVPDVSLDELGDLYRMVSSLWDKAGTRDKSRFTKADKLMHEILTDLGGLGRVRQPDKFWNRVQKEWRRHTGLTVSTNTLTVKARRLKKKLNEIDDHFNVYTGGETTS